MTLTLSEITTADDLIACESLQVSTAGERSHQVLRRPILISIQQAGGLILGAWETLPIGTRVLRGLLVDLHAHIDGFPARVTAVHLVSPEGRGRGIGTALRHREREILRDQGVSLVVWMQDPLRSRACRMALHTLGAIAVTYDRDVLGRLSEVLDAGLATDRLTMEWWLESPRVIGRLEGGAPPIYEHVGLQEMSAATSSHPARSGIRILTKIDHQARSRYTLIEIPAELDDVRRIDPAAARAWRVGTRETFEQLLGNGYVDSGFLHEGGRSFHLMEQENRGIILGRSGCPIPNERGAR